MNAEERLLHVIFATGETEAEAADRIRALKAWKALEHAPELVAHLRTQMLKSDGRTERGEWHRVKRTPLLTGITDAADEVYVVLLEWVAYWAEQFEHPQPLSAVAAWRTAGGIRRDGPDVAAGFRAGTSPEAAAGLVRRLVIWLQEFEMAITAHELGAEFYDEVSRVVWKYRAQSGLTDDRRARIREVSPRPCPNSLCGEEAVHGEFFGGTLAAAEARGERLSPYARRDESPEQALNAYLQAIAGVTVRCEACGWTEAPRASRIARWLA